jgi:O-antigen ligase
MPSRPGDAAAPPTSASTQLTAAILLLVVIGALGVYGLTMMSRPVLLGCAVIAAVAAAVLPRNALPAAALWLLILFPVGYMYVPVLLGRYITPAVLVIAIWMIRLALAQRMTHLLQTPIRGWLIALPLLMLLFASAVFSVRTDLTLAWLVVFIVCVVAPALLGQICLDDVWPTVRWSLAGIGLFLGVLAAADFLMHFNPWTQWYRSDLTASLREMSVFRTRTSLGHPLTTAMVASVALAACVFPSGKTRQWPYLIGAVGALVALILSVSRTSLIAVGLSAAVGMLSGFPRIGKSMIRARRRRRRRLIAVLMTATFIAALAMSPLLSSRNASYEGSGSATYRSQIFDVAKGLIAEHPMLGFGPGTSGKVYESSLHLGLENSALQLMVSIGLPAFLIVLVGFGVVVRVAMRRSRAGVAAAVVAFLISATGFNVVDSNPEFLALLAPLIACAVAPGLGRAGQTESPPGLPEREEATPPLMTAFSQDRRSHNDVVT